MRTTTDAALLATTSVRELIAELAGTEDALREHRCRGLTAGDAPTVRHQAALLRELRRRRSTHL